MNQPYNGRYSKVSEFASPVTFACRLVKVNLSVFVM
jgi:hypothetical protein